MFIKKLKSKLHRVRVTDTKLHYAGSVAIDAELMERVGIADYEAVTIADLDNANRLETYAVPAERGGKEVVIMGAAAKLIEKGDTVIIFAYGYMTEDEAKVIKPKVLAFNEKNEVIKSS